MKKLKGIFLSNLIVIIFSLALFLKGILFLFQINVQSVSFVYFLVTLLGGFLAFAPGMFLKGKVRNTYLILVSLFFSVLYLADLLYFRYFSSIPSFNSIVFATQVTGVEESILSLFRIQDILLFSDLILFFFYS